MTSHDAIVGAYLEEGKHGDIFCGIEVVCECGAILLDDFDDEALPFSEIADTVRAHREQADA